MPWGITISFFPVVGAILGGILVLLGNPLAVLIAWVFFTGAFHLDGLADTFDALAFAKSKEDRLKIMKDPHLGTFGAVSVSLLLISKLHLVSLVSGKALFLSPVLGRLSLVLTPFFSVSAKGEGLGYLVKASVGLREAVIASAITFFFSLCAGLWGIFSVVITVFLSYFLGGFFKEKFGGVTGDTLGAACELTEVVVLAFFALVGS